MRHSPLNGSPIDGRFLLFLFFIPGVALVFQFMKFIEFRLQSSFDTFKRTPSHILSATLSKKFSPCSSCGCARSISFYQYIYANGAL